MKIHPIKFMEKKIRRTSEDAKFISQRREEKTIFVSILVALVIMGVLLVKLTFFTPIETEPFSAIYYLDSEKQTTNLPKTVVLGDNSTFSLWVGVENHNDTEMEYEVRSMIDDGRGHVDTNSREYESNQTVLEDGGIWEFQIDISIEQLGQNRVIFSLWFFNQTINDWADTGNWVNLSIEAS